MHPFLFILKPLINQYMNSFLHYYRKRHLQLLTKFILELKLKRILVIVDFNGNDPTIDLPNDNKTNINFCMYDSLDCTKQPIDVITLSKN
jgi:hypothetical protein